MLPSALPISLRYFISHIMKYPEADQESHYPFRASYKRRSDKNRARPEVPASRRPGHGYRIVWTLVRDRGRARRSGHHQDPFAGPIAVQA